MQHFEINTWEQIKQKIRGIVDAEIYGLLDRIAKEKQNSSSKILIASYPYGKLIVKNGEFIPPCNCNDCLELYNGLKYNHIPLTLVLQNSVEVFEKLDEERTFPLRIMSEGEFFGLFEVMNSLLHVTPNSFAPWNVSSGASSIEVIIPRGNVKAILQKIKRLTNKKKQYKKYKSAFDITEYFWDTSTTNSWELVKFYNDPRNLDRVIRWCIV